MASSSSATPTATDAQTWVYPPPGAPTPPVAATSNFGPVHLYDKMVLQWSPSTSPDEILYVCFSESLKQSQWVVAKDQGQPLTYQFTSEALQSNSSDLLFCHFYFSPSVMGNTVVFQFKNEQAAEIMTWEGPTAPTSVSKTITSALSTSTGSLTSGTGRTSTSSSTPTSTSISSGGGLSTGASAGIGIGAAVAVLAIIAAVFFFFRASKQKKKLQNEGWDRPPPIDEVNFKHGGQEAIFPAATFGGEMHGSPPPVELRGSTPEHELHSWNSKRR